MLHCDLFQTILSNAETRSLCSLTETIVAAPTCAPQTDFANDLRAILLYQGPIVAQFCCGCIARVRSALSLQPDFVLGEKHACRGKIMLKACTCHNHLICLLSTDRKQRQPWRDIRTDRRSHACYQYARSRPQYGLGENYADVQGNQHGTCAPQTDFANDLRATLLYQGPIVAHFCCGCKASVSSALSLQPDFDLGENYACRGKIMLKACTCHNHLICMLSTDRSNVNLGEIFELTDGHMLAISTLAPGRNPVWGKIMLTYRKTSMVLAHHKLTLPVAQFCRGCIARLRSAFSV